MYRVLIVLCLLFTLPAMAEPASEGCEECGVSKGLLDPFLPERDVNRAFTGINAFVNEPKFGSVRDQLYEVRNSLGIKYVRVLFAWTDQIQPTPESPINFSFYDDIARSMPQGTEALVVLASVPSWMKNPANWRRGDPRATFIERWVTPVMKRYKRHSRLKAFQIWNEPNMVANQDNETLGVLEPQNYLKLLQGAYRQGKRINRRAKIVSAATTAINQNYPKTISYARALRDGGLHRFCDVIALHYYGSHLENVLRPGGAGEYIESLKKPVWVTESGEKGIYKQREYVRRYWSWLEREFPQIRRMYYYQFTDTAPLSETYGLKVLNPGVVVSDLYLYFRDENPAMLWR